MVQQVKKVTCHASLVTRVESHGPCKGERRELVLASDPYLGQNMHLCNDVHSLIIVIIVKTTMMMVRTTIMIMMTGFLFTTPCHCWGKQSQILFSFETGSQQVALGGMELTVYNSLAWTHKDPPDSAFTVLRWKVCATTPGNVLWDVEKPKRTRMVHMRIAFQRFSRTHLQK